MNVIKQIFLRTQVNRLLSAITSFIKCVTLVFVTELIVSEELAVPKIICQHCCEFRYYNELLAAVSSTKLISLLAENFL